MFELFKTFSKKELLLFEEFLNNKFFNGSDILKKLFENLLEVPDFDKEKIINNLLIKPEFLGKKYSEKVIWEYYYKLNHKADEFLCYRRFFNDEISRLEFLLSELYDRNVEKNFFKIYKILLEKNLQRKDSTQKYQCNYFLNEKMYNFSEKNSHLLKHKNAIAKSDHVIKCVEFKTIQYFVELVSLYTTFRMNEFSYNVNIQEPLSFKSDFVRNLYLSISSSSNTCLSELYFHLYKMINKFDNFNAYVDYKNFFFECLDTLDPEEVKYHFQIMIKYCTIKKSLDDNSSYLNDELISLYKIYLQKNLFIYENEKYIQTRLILNIVKLFKRSGNLDWLKEFLENNISILNPVDKNNVKHFLNVYYYFVQEKFEKALIEINKIDLDVFSYKYEIHTLRIRILFEIDKGDNESVLNSLDAYRTLLRNDQFLLPVIKEKILNFLRFLEHLIKKIDNKRELEYFYYKLKKDNHIYFKDWLTKKYLNQLR